jgi:hypothetical protein
MENTIQTNTATNGQELLAMSKNDIGVYLDPVYSHTATHFADAPQLRGLVKEIVEKTVLDQDLMLFDTNMGHVIGNSDLVENSENDTIIYAKRINRDIYTSFNMSQPPQPCSIVAISLKRQSSHSYELLSAWVGSTSCPPFPGDIHETPESKPFWMHHSLAWGTQEIQEDTKTMNCPW